MKYIKLFEDINSDPIWPSYSNGDTDFYFTYNHDRLRNQFLNTWFVGEVRTLSTGKIAIDDRITLKKCDKSTSQRLYNREYNPISIGIRCPLGARFTQNESGQDLYEMLAKIRSIDDSSFTIWWKGNPIEELRKIREDLMNWIDSHPLINGDRFLRKCVELGASEDQINYD